jgi:hypothetical protein
MKEYVIRMPSSSSDWCYILSPEGERSTYEAKVFPSLEEAEKCRQSVLMTVRFRPPEFYGKYPYGVSVKARFEKMTVTDADDVHYWSDGRSVKFIR